MWTFSFRYQNENLSREWATSQQAYENITLACLAAADWSEVCRINDAPIEFRLVKLS